MTVKARVRLENDAEIIKMPAVPMRGLVVFPGNILQFEVGRTKSIAAVDHAMDNGKTLFLVAQKRVEVDEPGKDDLYDMGVVAEVKKVLHISDEVVKVLVEAKYRAKLLMLHPGKDFLVASTKPAPLRTPQNVTRDQLEALVRAVKEEFERYIMLNQRLPKDVIYTIFSTTDPRILVDYLPGNLLFKYQEKQEILAETNVNLRLEKIAALLAQESNIISIEKGIQEKVNQQIDKNQKDYYLREQMRIIAGELGDEENTAGEAEQYRKRIAELKLSADITEKLLKEVDRLAKMQGMTQEAAVIRSYLDACLELPWNTYSVDQLDIGKAKNNLDRGHYGLKEVKDRILEILAVRQLAPDIHGQIICLVGPPGVGKTSIASAIAQSMGRAFVRMSLGGVRDEAEIRGHRRTYVGAMPGKIMSAMQSSKSANPVLLLDEIDKLASDFRGDPAAALLEALDPEQNKNFKDHYLDIPFDLSKVLFITTANTTDTIPRPLLDRMDVIEVPSYTRDEKFQIAKRHLIPKQLTNTGLKGRVKITDAALYELIDYYTKEAGVRNLERVIQKVLRKCAVPLTKDKEAEMTVKPANIESLIGPHRVKKQFSLKKDAVGVANGLAWTTVGGELLPIEVEIVPDAAGHVELTGSLGEVMKESAKLALTYAKVHAKEYGIDAEKLRKSDIHIHAPEGAVPKDGPSAGVTLTTALLSRLAQIPVRANVAMTGEITLQGNVLPIGGLKEKSMAAYREGIDTVIIPQDNAEDLWDLDEGVKSKIRFLPVSNIKQVLEIALKQGPDAAVPFAPKAAKKLAGTTPVV